MMGSKGLGQKGFTLIEIMIAMTIFAVFISVFMTSQGSNLADSTLLREEIFLRQLAEERINEIVANPPDLKDSLTLSKETKTFEKYPAYEFDVEWKKFKLPDLSKLQGKEEGDEDNDQMAEASGIEKTLFNKVKENMEKLLWQVEVTVRNKETRYFLQASTWIIAQDVKVQIDAY